MFLSVFYDAELLKSGLSDFVLVWAMNYYFENSFIHKVFFGLTFMRGLGNGLTAFSGG